MGYREAFIRFSNVSWIEAVSSLSPDDLRGHWVALLGPRTPSDSFADLPSQVGSHPENFYPEFRHQPPVHHVSIERLQGGTSKGVFFGARFEKDDQPQIFENVRSISRPFRVLSTDRFRASGRIGSQLFRSGYLIVELTLRVRLEKDNPRDRLWDIVRLLSPNEIRSDVTFAKHGISASPRDFAQSIFDGVSHSLLLPPGRVEAPRSRWHVGIAANDGPNEVAPSDIIGHKIQLMLEFGIGDLQVAERGYYYPEDSHRHHRQVRRRFETLRTIFDFTRYQRDYIQRASAQTSELSKALLDVRLGVATHQPIVGPSAIGKRAEHLDSTARVFEAAVSPVLSQSSAWQRKIHSLFSESLDLPRAHHRFEKAIAEIAVDLSDLRTRPEFRRHGSEAKPIDVFISYARKDADLVLPLRKLLEGIGLRVFLDTHGGINPGDDFPQAIGDAIAACKAVLAVWTSVAFTRPWCRRESYMGEVHEKLVAVARAPFTQLEMKEFMPTSYVDLKGFESEPHAGWSTTLVNIAEKMERWLSYNGTHPDALETARLANATRAASKRAKEGLP